MRQIINEDMVMKPSHPIVMAPISTALLAGNGQVSNPCLAHSLTAFGF